MLIFILIVLLTDGITGRNTVDGIPGFSAILLFVAAVVVIGLIFVLLFVVVVVVIVVVVVDFGWVN